MGGDGDEERVLITVIPKFNGPLDSGNGSYARGLFARELGDRAEVSRRRPVPSATLARLLSAAGEVLATCHVMMVEPRPA
jgi:hypothetical protein